MKKKERSQSSESGPGKTLQGLAGLLLLVQWAACDLPPQRWHTASGYARSQQGSRLASWTWTSWVSILALPQIGASPQLYHSVSVVLSLYSSGEKSGSPSSLVCVHLEQLWSTLLFKWIPWYWAERRQVREVAVKEVAMGPPGG